MMAFFSLFFILSDFVSPYTCTDDVLKQNYHNQNMCKLLDEIPLELKNLPYAIYPNNSEYDTDVLSIINVLTFSLMQS